MGGQCPVSYDLRIKSHSAFLKDSVRSVRPKAGQDTYDHKFSTQVIIFKEKKKREISLHCPAQPPHPNSVRGMSLAGWQLPRWLSATPTLGPLALMLYSGVSALHRGQGPSCRTLLTPLSQTAQMETNAFVQSVRDSHPALHHLSIPNPKTQNLLK